MYFAREQPVRATLVGLTCGLLFPGCTSYPRRTTPPVAPPSTALYLAGAEGVQLYCSILGLAKGSPEGSATPRGVIWYVVGAEIGSAPLYPNFSRELHKAGFLTAVMHPRGAGFSSGLRGDLANYQLFLNDYSTFLQHLQQRFGDTPIFLLGQSAGAAIALHLAANTKTTLGGLILVNPAYKLRSASGMGPSVVDYITYAANYLFRPAALTVDMNRNPSAIQNAQDREESLSMQRDPLVVRYFSMRYLFAQKKIMDRCAKNIASIDAPILLVQGSQDELVDPRGTEQLFLAAQSKDKCKLVASNGGHGASSVESMIQPLLDWLLCRTLWPTGTSKLG